MVIPGYDIDDLDEHLRELLTDDEFDQLRNGAPLLDVLDEEDIDRFTAGERRRR